MQKIISNITIYSLLVAFLICTQAKSDTKKISNGNHQINLYGGVFDFSDDKQKAGLFGFQHQNESLERETFLGNISPITGGFITENSAVYVYSGIEWNYVLGNINFTPSFAPGLYEEGDGKDLGHVLEFKTEVQASIDISQNTSLGMSYNHISNASLGDKNPGANSYTLNFLKKF
jgi:lipid A 3-O-deacylase